MNNDLLNILSNSNKDIDNQRLMDYLSGKLSAAERHEVERLMADNEFTNDAMEGLDAVSNKRNLEALVEQMNRELHQRLEEKKQHKEKRKIREYPVVYIAIVLIITMAILAWYIIQKMQRS